MRARPVVVGRKRQRRHDRAEVGAADPDVDDIREGLAVGRRQLARAHLLGEGEEALQLGLDQRIDRHAVDRGPARPTRAQRRVQHSAPLRAIDRLAGEHAPGMALHIRLLGKPEKQLHRLLDDEILGIVEMQPRPLDMEAVEALGIGGEQLAQGGEPHALGVAVEGGEGGADGHATVLGGWAARATPSPWGKVARGTRVG